MLATTIGIAIVILIGYLATLIIIKPNEIDYKIFKHISYKLIL